MELGQITHYGQDLWLLNSSMRPRTLKYKKILITGCARSGTRYISYLLCQLGMDVGHEHMGKDGIASWPMAINTNSSPWGPSRKNYAFKYIFHQVRHPLNVIPSLFELKKDSWEFICSHTPCYLDEPLILRAAKYWYYWNREAEKMSHWRYKIENLPNIFEQFCDQLELPPQKQILNCLPRDINTRRYGKLFHYHDELCKRLHIRPNIHIRQWLRSSNYNRKYPSISWGQLKSVDSRWCEVIQKKAVIYGYKLTK